MSPAEDSEVIGQAIYTWSTARLDRTPGVGFSAISPSLVASVDWLTKLQPQEFKLFRGEVTGQDADLTAARKDFSQVGRLVHRDRAIIFCKTADGTLDDKKRPHPVVHALIGRTATLGLSCILRINGAFWRRTLEGPVSGIQLDDLAMPSIRQDEVPMADHACPGDHALAGDILALVADRDMEGAGTIDLPTDDAAVPLIFLAFPADMAESFCLDSYVTLKGVWRELGLSVPAGGAPPTLLPPARTAEGEAAPAPCRFQRAVEESATRFLRNGNPQLSKYAQAVLEAGRSQPRHSRSTPRPTPGSAGHGADLGGATHRILRETQPQGGPLTPAESRRMLDTLRSEHVSAWSVVNMPATDLTDIFAEVGEEPLIARWAQYFGAVGAERFGELWNSTRVSAFLGLVLVKDPGPGVDGDGFRLAAHRGENPQLTESILRSMRQRNGGGQSIAHAIMRGLGASDSMRVFIAESLEDDPAFLFDAVLRNADIPENHLIDYIKACYKQWVAYRALPDNESTAIAHVINRLSLYQRVKGGMARLAGGPGSG